MEHTKKLVLVSPEVLDRAKDSRPQRLEKTKVRELEDQLSSVLNDPHLDDTTKMKRYSEVLQRYTVYHAKADELPQIRVLPGTKYDAQSKDTSQTRAIERDVIESVPRAFKSKATQLLGKMTSSDSGLYWTDRGELIVDDRTIKGSHIVDLVNDMMRKRKSATPVGMDEFTKALARINTPRELIGNPDRWKEYAARMFPMEAYLNNLYYDPSHPAAFGGVGAIKRAAKQDKRNISVKKITEWLQGRDAYTLHKPPKKTFQRNKVIVSGIDSQWQADLVDVSSFAKQNRGYRYILTCIDILSKFAWARALKDKTSRSVTRAFRSILKEQNRKPQALQTDKGKEFLNKPFQKFLRDEKIRFFTTNNETKASVVERFNRTLKTKMWRYFTANGTRRYSDVLQKFLDGYNRSKHRSIGMAPKDVNEYCQEKVWQRLYGDVAVAEREFKFALGDTVRISMATRPFRKGYLPQWTDEVFTVARRIQRVPPVYRLKDYDGEMIEGTFYEQEMQKVSKEDQTYRIEKIIRRRTRSGRKEYFVKWKGYPSKFNSWVTEVYTYKNINSSPLLYPDNTVTHYRVKLAQPISLEGQWEVGLAEIIYPHQWYNVDEECEYSYTVNGGDQWWRKHIQPGHYGSMKDIFELLETNYLEHIKYIYHDKTRKLEIRLEEGAQVRFKGRLADMLGFQTEAPTVTQSITLDRPIDLRQPHNLFVYCDIVEPRAVGHTRVPLLRVVNVKQRYGEDVSMIFTNIHYQPVKQKYFDTIEMDIRDSVGRKVPFVRGNVIVTLHFRLKRASHFV
ncbi:Endogenous retrovirus group K member 19 Pol protein [Holothuria leucospilota]|uniref:Endogenous retrovirus group K member 19 Pol protein n=1 Tax=Holothuria leucospilota TaxID=206669 RepID=A0A9Q1CA85_HOLLE|nr:Endogenous retrovirus group K member 19 Pol protein [Holothuria leucospilota]